VDNCLRDCFRSAIIAEDNVVLCRSLVRLASSWGTRVLAATTVAQALQHLTDPVDLVISDVRFPDGNARTIFEQVARSKPATVMVAISGRASAAEAFALAALGVHAFVAKPFTTRHLETALLDVLRARQSAACGTKGAGEQTLRLMSEDLYRFSTAYGLSDQQSALLRLLMIGVPRKDIPAALGITENTCKTIVRRLLARCGARRVMDVVRAATAERSGTVTLNTDS
jgi:DNA-binding NarL/FixJ family response regulator